MREIKFRMQDALRNWVYITIWNVYPIKMEYYTNLCQYTGLHDKNGKEIYEGDIIIKHGTDYDPNTWRGEKRVVEQKDGSWYPVAHCYFDVRLIEVVGNVYENPELLKDGK